MAVSNSKKSHFIVAIILFAFVVALLSYFYTTNVSTENTYKTAVEQTVIETQNTNQSNLVNQQKDPANQAIEKWNPMGSPADTAEIKDWFAQRGNFSFMGDIKLGDYTTYDDSVLAQLGENGDLRALHVLADRAKNIKEFRSILQTAAVFGSTEALVRLGAINEAEDLGNMKSEERKEKIIQALSYYDAAQLRGDWWGNIVRGQNLQKRYSHELNEQDKIIIQENAKAIYDQAQSERHTRGLGNFDNEVPDSVIKFYEEMLRPL